MLNIKDKNIVFLENFYSEGIVNGILSMFFYAKLTYTPHSCSNCGSIFDRNIIKYGFKSSIIKMPSISGFNAFLKLKKQRYLCKHCNSTFTLNTPLVSKHCYISNNTKLAIALNCKDKLSEKDIARKHNVSHSTVNRIIDNFYENHSPNYNYLPRHLCFDEFKSVKAASGAMSFIFCESDTSKIIDIVEDRRLSSLTNYFLKYSKSARSSVETIVIDMYSPYISIISKLFPRANIIIDKFHIVQLFNRALNKTRIKLMNSNKNHYNKLKKHWKLLLKRISDVDYENYHYSPSFRKNMRDIDILNYLLDLDEELKSSYELYQKIMLYLRNADFLGIQNTLSNVSPNVSTYMKTSIKTIRKYITYVENTLKYSYTNGVLEGINNKIKVLKRLAFGYKSFYHFRNRIMIIQNLSMLKA